MTLPLYRPWKSSETEIIVELDSSWKSQYREFEFTSLRHVVSTADKFCYLVREIREKCRIFAKTRARMLSYRCGICEKGRVFAIFSQPIASWQRPWDTGARPLASRSRVSLRSCEVLCHHSRFLPFVAVNFGLARSAHGVPG